MVLACLLSETIGRRYWQMLWTVIVILLILWALGGFLALGPLVHLLLVIALIVLLVQLISGRRVAL
jgi:uncharacterized protein DUF5670